MPLDRFIPPPAPASPALLLVEEISHRVINEYTEAIGSLRLAAAGIPNAQAQRTLTAAADRLRAYAAAHRALMPPDRSAMAELGDYLGQLCASLSIAGLADTGVALRLETDEIWLPVERCWRVGLILAELVRNAARHGLGGGPGSILVRLSEDAAGVRCLVRDSGRVSLNPTPGRGRGVVEALAADLRGSVEWRFGPGGCCVELQFPNPAKAI